MSAILIVIIIITYSWSSSPSCPPSSSWLWSLHILDQSRHLVRRLDHDHDHCTVLIMFTVMLTIIVKSSSLSSSSWWILLAYQSSLGFDEGSVLSVDLVVEAAGVAQVLTVTIAPPQGGRCRPTVHTFTTLCKNACKSVFKSQKQEPRNNERSNDERLISRIERSW